MSCQGFRDYRDFKNFKGCIAEFLTECTEFDVLPEHIIGSSREGDMCFTFCMAKGLQADSVSALINQRLGFNAPKYYGEPYIKKLWASGQYINILLYEGFIFEAARRLTIDLPQPIAIDDAESDTDYALARAWMLITRPKIKGSVCYDDKRTASVLWRLIAACGHEGNIKNALNAARELLTAFPMILPESVECTHYAELMLKLLYALKA